MGIIVVDPNTDIPFSTGDFSNPISTMLNGTDGDSYDIPLKIKSDTNTREYHNVRISIANPHPRITYKFALDENGLPGTFTDTLSIDVVNSDGVTFWMHKEVQPDTPTELYKNAKVHIEAMEVAVE